MPTSGRILPPVPLKPPVWRRVMAASSAAWEISMPAAASKAPYMPEKLAQPTVAELVVRGTGRGYGLSPKHGRTKAHQAGSRCALGTAYTAVLAGAALQQIETQNDRDRHADQPSQNAPTHTAFLFGFHDGSPHCWMSRVSRSPRRAEPAVSNMTGEKGTCRRQVPFRCSAFYCRCFCSRVPGVASAKEA